MSLPIIEMDKLKFWVLCICCFIRRIMKFDFFFSFLNLFFLKLIQNVAVQGRKTSQLSQAKPQPTSSFFNHGQKDDFIDGLD